MHAYELYDRCTVSKRYCILANSRLQPTPQELHVTSTAGAAKKIPKNPGFEYCGEYRIRTGRLLHAMQAL